MVVLILVATLATEIAITARTHFDLSSHSMNDFLLRSVVEGRTQILRKAVAYDLSLADNIDKEDDVWAWHDSRTLSSWGEASGTATTATASDEGTAQATVYRNRDVKILAWGEDERSKINLRGLLWEEDTPTFLHTREALVRLIDVYRAEWPELDLIDSDAREMVNDLVEWMNDKEDTDENPLAPVKARMGRVLALEDLLRVPGGRWRPELCFDVRIPKQTEEGDFSQGLSGPAPESEDGTPESDASWERQNGVPGLFRYVTVWGEGTANTPPRINVNTAPRPVLAALFEPENEDHADAILSQRREGGTGDSSGGSGSSGAAAAGSFFTQKADLTKVEGLGDDLGRYPRLDFFAETKSSVFSLRVIATMSSGRLEADEEDEDAQSRDIVASYQYREIVQRSTAGIVSLHAERRTDPLFPEGE